MKKIVVVGSSNTDMVINVDRIPKGGETVIGNNFSMIPGGKGANQAVAASRGGGDVTFIANIGKDTFGDRSIKGFLKDGINVDYIVRDKKIHSGMALINVDKNGENSISVAVGSNDKLSSKDIEKGRRAIESADTLLVHLEIPSKTVSKSIELSYSHGVKVILNPAPIRKFDRRILKKVFIMTPNEHEAEALTGIKIRTENDAKKASRKILKEVMEAVIITMGSRGAFVATKDFQKLVPAFKTKVVDTTAAGDTFNGFLAVALAENKDLLDAVRFANAAAVLSTRKVGAQPSIPTRKEVEKLLG